MLEMPSGTGKTVFLLSLIVTSILFYARVTVCWRCPQVQGRLERSPLMWMMPLHLDVNQKSDYDDMMMYLQYCSILGSLCVGDALWYREDCVFIIIDCSLY